MQNEPPNSTSGSVLFTLALCTLHFALNGGSEGTRTLSLPADNGLLWLLELRIQKWLARPKPWRTLVGGAGNAPVVASDSYLYIRHRIYRPAAGTPPEIGSGG